MIIKLKIRAPEAHCYGPPINAGPIVEAWEKAFNASQKNWENEREKRAAAEAERDELRQKLAKVREATRWHTEAKS